MPETETAEPMLEDDYWDIARRPFNSWCFLLPILVAYEAGVLWLGGAQPEMLRNGADCWMRSALQSLGGDYGWLLPLVVTAGLLIWQAACRQPWTVSPESWLGMLAESFLFAAFLVVIGQLQGLAFQTWGPGAGVGAVSMAVPPGISRSISFLGAGIYEEVLFRMCLIPVCYGLWRVLLLPHRGAVFMAVLLSSLLFAAAHYVGPSGEAFLPYTFTFRAVAGTFFAGLFVLRGFGVAAGTHATYDLLVGVVLIH